MEIALNFLFIKNAAENYNHNNNNKNRKFPIKFDWIICEKEKIMKKKRKSTFSNRKNLSLHAIKLRFACEILNHQFEL